MPVRTHKGSLVIQMVDKNEVGGKKPIFPDFTVQDEELLVVLGQHIAASTFSHMLQKEASKVQGALHNLHTVVEMATEASNAYTPHVLLDRMGALIHADISAVWMVEPSSEYDSEPPLRRESVAKNWRCSEQNRIEKSIMDGERVMHSFDAILS